MKDKRPIETQVAELTPEQKKTIRRVGICYDIIMCVVVLAYMVVALTFMAQLARNNEKLENFSLVSTSVNTGVVEETYSPLASAEYQALIGQQEQNMTTFAMVAGIGFVAVLAVMGAGLLIIAVKFPYYSDKRFVYIGRQLRQQK